jgi:hypothetical protein
MFLLMNMYIVDRFSAFKNQEHFKKKKQKDTIRL